MKKKLSVIVPAYNEARNIGKNIASFLRYLKNQDYDFELILVNDGSTDQTGRIIAAMAGEEANLSMIDLPRNHGKGAAVKAGAMAAKGDYLAFLDADGATSIDHLDKIWPEFKKGAALVIGSRHSEDCRGAKIEVPQAKWKQSLGRAGNRLIRLLTGLPYRDTQCGFKAFGRRAAKALFGEQKTRGWAFDIELLLLAEKHGFKTAAVPVVWKNIADSRVGLKGYFGALAELISIRLRLRGKSAKPRESKK